MMLNLTLALVALPVLAADTATPGFWERTWEGTKKGTSHVWSSTKRVGEKTAELATAPFHRGKKISSEPKSVWRQFGVSITLDPSAVKLPDTRAIHATVTLVNKGKTPAQLEFPSSQRIEVLVKNEADRVLSRWSDDQKLDKEQGFLVINPEERLEYTATISTRDMSAGQTYIVEAYFPNFDQLRASRTIVPTK